MLRSLMWVWHVTAELAQFVGGFITVAGTGCAIVELVLGSVRKGV
jgi:hypothetical protein